MIVENWTFRKRPAHLERRINFSDFDLLRDFLDYTAELSEREGYYPDMNFGRTHVNMTINLNDGSDVLDEKQIAFIEQLNIFAPGNEVVSKLNVKSVVEKESK